LAAVAVAFAYVVGTLFGSLFWLRINNF
jgi:hypothetical protein